MKEFGSNFKQSFSHLDRSPWILLLSQFSIFLITQQKTLSYFLVFSIFYHICFTLKEYLSLEGTLRHSFHARFQANLCYNMVQAGQHLHVCIQINVPLQQPAGTGHIGICKVLWRISTLVQDAGTVQQGNGNCKCPKPQEELKVPTGFQPRIQSREPDRTKCNQCSPH